MPDEPKRPSPPQKPPGGTTPQPQPPPFDPDYDLITDMERSPKHDLSKRVKRPKRT